jgi:hypothetical protein
VVDVPPGGDRHRCDQLVASIPYGIPELVGLLQVLSALRYPPSENALKYELWTLIRALITLTIQNRPADISEENQSLHSHELFIDDPEVLEVLQEPLEELEES